MKSRNQDVGPLVLPGLASLDPDGLAGFGA